MSKIFFQCNAGKMSWKSLFVAGGKKRYGGLEHNLLVTFELQIAVRTPGRRELEQNRSGVLDSGRAL
jgi:hypothetical protein